MRRMTSAIVTSALTKRYGEARGVFDLDLEVEEGEIYGFLGPNGAGKTTTIRMLLDLVRPQSGTATVFGHDCRRESREVRRLVGYLPGEFALDPKLTGDDLLTYLGNLRGGVERAQVLSLAERLDVDLRRPFGQYSRGNKQKIGVIQAFMHRPRLLVLDEPTGGLDPIYQEVVLELVRSARAEGATVFFSSHILSEVEAVCGRVAFIRDGRLIRGGTVMELLRLRGHELEAECAQQPDLAALARLEGVTNLRVDGCHVALHVQGDMSGVVMALAPHGVQTLTSREPSLADIFMGLYEGTPGAAPETGGAG
jgi:ABC-2 type transport system ATP-binding protein